MEQLQVALVRQELVQEPQQGRLQRVQQAVQQAPRRAPLGG